MMGETRNLPNCLPNDIIKTISGTASPFCGNVNSEIGFKPSCPAEEQKYDVVRLFHKVGGG